MGKWGRACAVEIGAYCWMPNHVHLIAGPEAAPGVRRTSAYQSCFSDTVRRGACSCPEQSKIDCLERAAEDKGSTGAATPLILIALFQLRHEHQPADTQPLQLSLSFGEDRRAGTHMARDYGAQLGIVRAHEARNLGELGRVAGETQDRQIGLVERSVEREVADQGGMTIVEDRETVLESD